MSYTLESHGRTLGRTGAELPPPTPDTRSWHFIPAPAFAEARALFAALPAAIEDSEEAIPTQGELEAIPREEQEAHMRALLRSDPRMARFIELSEQLEAMALTLKDAHGERLDTATIGVTELTITPAEFREVLATVDPGADLSEVAAPIYLLVAG
jgi:hypothetical protein